MSSLRGLWGGFSWFDANLHSCRPSPQVVDEVVSSGKIPSACGDGKAGSGRCTFRS